MIAHILAIAAAYLGKLIAGAIVAAYMDLERRLGKSKYGSVLGVLWFVFLRFLAILRGSKKNTQEGKEEP